MNNNQNKSPNDEDIDILETLQKLWKEKWIIIFFTFFSTLIGTYYSSTQSDNYRVSIDITKASDSTFFRFITLNDILSKTPIPFKDATLDSKESFYSLSSESVFDKFISQYTFRNGIIEVLTKENFLETLSVDKNNIININLKAKNFTINQDKKNKNTYRIEFNWPSIDQIDDLADQTIQQTLFYVKVDILNDLNAIKDFIVQKKQRMLSEINEELETLLFQENDIINTRLLFLKEQFTIAKKLGIQYNSLDGGVISSTLLETESYSLTTSNKTSTPYYLIGYEAIEQEIRNLENRTDADKLLLSDSYLNLIRDRREIENDTTSTKLQEAVNLFKDVDHFDWISYNLSFSDISNQKKSSFTILILSGLIGLSLGIVFVLQNIFIRKKLKKT
tara:strand:- start:210 stop:1382 length:1173 start_codon:yes stop_codon:yes gene_type:complete